MGPLLQEQRVRGGSWGLWAAGSWPGQQLDQGTNLTWKIVQSTSRFPRGPIPGAPTRGPRPGLSASPLGELECAGRGRSGGRQGFRG